MSPRPGQSSSTPTSTAGWRTDALGASLVWTYDDIGNQIYQRNRTDPLMTNSVVWTYDPAGRFKSWLDAVWCGGPRHTRGLRHAVHRAVHGSLVRRPAQGETGLETLRPEGEVPMTLQAAGPID